MAPPFCPSKKGEKKDWESIEFPQQHSAMLELAK